MSTTNTDFTRLDPAEFSQRTNCPCCQATWRNEGDYGSRLIGVEYAYGCPERYDGVSEWKCPDCACRWGRWTGRLLADGEAEPRFGGED